MHRQITDNPIWDTGEPFDMAHAWVDLLLCVNHADREKIVSGKKIVVKRGEVFASESFFANRWHWSRGRVRRFFAAIETARMAIISRTSDGTRIYLVNYSNYQNGRTANGTANGTADDTRVFPVNYSNSRCGRTANGTANGTADGTQYKNIKNNKNNIKRSFQNFEMSNTDWNGLAEQIINKTSPPE